MTQTQWHGNLQGILHLFYEVVAATAIWIEQNVNPKMTWFEFSAERSDPRRNLRRGSSVTIEVEFTSFIQSNLHMDDV